MSARRTTRKPPPARNRADARDDDPVPASIDELHREFSRRAGNITQAWRKCRRPPCRRGRRCTARVSCAAHTQRRELPEHKRAMIMAHLYRRIQRMVAAARTESGDR
jgi:hypothetical protein